MSDQRSGPHRANAIGAEIEAGRAQNQGTRGLLTDPQICAHSRPQPGDVCQLCGSPCPRALAFIATDPGGSRSWSYDATERRWCELAVSV